MGKHTATLEGRPIKIGRHYRVHGQPGRSGHWSVPITYTDTGEHIVMPRAKFYKAMRKEQRISQGQPCKHGDPLCPCPDGDLCHYEGDDAWPSPRVVSHQNNPLSAILSEAKTGS